MQALLRDLDSARASLEQAQVDFRARRGEPPARGIIADADLDRRARTARHRRGRRCGPRERRVEQARATLEGARDTLAKTTVRAPMDGDRHRQAGRGGRGRGDRRPEPAGHGAAHHLRHVGGRDRAGGRRDLDPLGEGRAGGARPRSTPTPTGPSTASSPRWARSPIAAPRPSRRPRPSSSRSRSRSRTPRTAIKPGLSVQADILTGFARAGAGGPDPGPRRARRSSARPGQRRPARAPREDEEGVYLVKDGKADFQPDQDRPARRAVGRGVEGLKGGETIITGPFRALRSAQARRRGEGRRSRSRAGPTPRLRRERREPRRAAARGAAGDPRPHPAQLPDAARASSSASRRSSASSR